MRTSWIIAAVIVLAIVSAAGYYYATSVNVAVHAPPETSKPPAETRGDTFGKTERQLVFPGQQQRAADKPKK